MFKRLGNYRFNWKLSLFTILFFPIMVKLGFWQLDREQEKLELQNIYTVRQSAPAITLDDFSWSDDLQYMSVSLQGRYDNEHTFFLDNKINEGRVGFEVISPFMTENGTLVLVNRGWAPQGKYRSDLPVVDRIDNAVSLRASVYISLGKQVMLAEEAYNDSQSWPRVIQSLEPETLIEQSGLEAQTIFPYSVRLQENTPGVLVRNWPVISTSPEKHKGYAIQWFLMASVLLFLYLYVSTKPESKEPLKNP